MIGVTVALVITAGVVSAALVFVAGALNCRAEEEYCAEYWMDTPSTEGVPACSCISIPQESDDEQSHRLPRAA